MVDEREVWHGLDYYGRDGGLSVPLKAWRRHDIPKNFAEEEPIVPPEDERALIVSVHKGLESRIRGDFDQIEQVDEVTIDLGGGKTRRFSVFIGTGYNPKPRTLEYEQYHDALSQ